MVTRPLFMTDKAIRDRLSGFLMDHFGPSAFDKLLQGSHHCGTVAPKMPPDIVDSGIETLQLRREASPPTVENWREVRRHRCEVPLRRTVEAHLFPFPERIFVGTVFFA